MKKFIYFFYFILFMVASGNLLAQKKVAYVTMDKEMDASATQPAEDPIVTMLKADGNLDVDTWVVAEDSVFDLSEYDVVIGQEPFGSSTAIWQPEGSLGMGALSVPHIINKVYAMKETRGFAEGTSGSGGEGTSDFFLKVDAANQSHDLFKGLTFDGDSIRIFKAGYADDGANDGEHFKGLQYATDVAFNPANTAIGMASLAPDNATVGINYLTTGDSIGSEEMLAPMFTMAMNYGAICGDGGNNITGAGLTIWRNAVYSLAGLDVPTTPVEVEEEEADYDIVYVTNPDNENGNDSLQIEYVEELGYTVRQFTDAQISTMPSDTIDMLNAAKLVIIGRSASSPNYGSEAALDKYIWNKDITVPLIVTHQYIGRSTRLNWFNSTSISHVDTPVDSVMYANIWDTSDEVFANVTPDGDSIPWTKLPEDIFIVEPSGSNANFLATTIYDGDTCILFARIDPGVEFYPEAGETEKAAAPRTYFGFGNNNDANYVNFFPLTDDAQKVFKAEIARLVALDYTVYTDYPSDDCTLSALSLTGATISFDAATLEYTVEFAEGTTSTEVTATSTDSNAIITGSGSITVDAAGGTINIDVVAADGYYSSTYVITYTVEQSASTDASLASLVPNTGTLDPTFSSTVYSYTLAVSSYPVTFTYTTTDDGASVSVPTIEVAGEYTITVTAEDASTQDYTIIVSTTATEDISAAGIRAYPNPATSVYTVEGLNEGATISIINITGQTIHTAQVTETSININLARFTKGLYIMKISNNDKVYSTRFMKQ